VTGMGNNVIATPSELGNYKIADTTAGDRAGMLWTGQDARNAEYPLDHSRV